MSKYYMKRFIFFCFTVASFNTVVFSQGNFNLKFKNSAVYAGIEVGSKGVKMSVLEIGKSTKKMVLYSC